MELKKLFRSAAIVLAIFAILWLRKNWSVLPGLMDVGFHIPYENFIIFGIGYVTCIVSEKLNEDSPAVKAAKAKGKAKVKSAKADMVDKKKGATAVEKARARSVANIAAAKAAESGEN